MITRVAMLNEIVKCCEARFSHGDISTWKHGDFVDLNREILRDTNTNISPSTLKRIFGKVSVDEDYIPQQATLDALKKYGRYPETENPPPVILPSAETNPPVSTPNFKRRNLIFIALFAGAVILAFITWRIMKPAPIKGKIKLVRTEGNLPATAFFELQLPESDDSLFVSFGDKSPVLYIAPGEKTAAHIYYFPGVFTVSVKTRRQAAGTSLAHTNIYIKSDGWIAFACRLQDDIPADFYAFPPTKSGVDSLFGITNNQLSKMGLDTTGLILTRLSNYAAIASEPDDFIFEASFKNTLPKEGIYCSSTQFQISGSNSMIRFRLSSPGCSLRILNVLSEQTFKGAAGNLSQFVFDLSQWNTVKLVNHKKQVSLFVNGRQIFTGAYQQSIGEVRGLFLEFEGTGIVKNCDLKSYDGKTVYHF